MDRAELERMDREGLVLRAQAAGVKRARLLTRPELVDELLRLDPVIDETQLKRTRGFFGRARDLLSRVVERGLHLPDAADRLRAALGTPLPQVPRPEPQAVPTVTLAEIYAAQGHNRRAIETLRRVLDAEPDHGAARTLLEKLEAADYVPPVHALPPEADADEARRAGEIGANLGTHEPAPPIVEAVASAFATPPTEALPRVSDSTTLPMDEPPVVFQRRSEPLTFGEAECVAIPVGPDASYVWWRLPEGAEKTPGAFVVRALTLVPTWEGPQVREHDFGCEPMRGELVLGGLPERSIVRVAIGFIDHGVFTPLAHSPALEMTATRELVRWTLDGSMPIENGDPRAASILLASEAATRMARPG